jgi:hypothetical protein
VTEGVNGRTTIKCTGRVDNGDPLWMGETLEGWWVLGKHGNDAWIDLPAGMEPGTTHVRLGVNNEVTTDKFDPPRLPNQIERPFNWLAWADGRCSRVVGGRHQFLCHSKCFGDPYQGVQQDILCAVARSAWVAKNPRVRNPSMAANEYQWCHYQQDCAPNPNRGGWKYTRCSSDERCKTEI